MTNNNQEKKCTCNYLYPSNERVNTPCCIIHSQLSSVPVEKIVCPQIERFGRCEIKGCGVCGKAKEFLSPTHHEASPKVEELPSTPEVSWEKQFSGQFLDGDDITGCGKTMISVDEELIDFIKSVEKNAYWSGIKVMEEEIGKETLTERKRVNDILDGVEDNFVDETRRKNDVVVSRNRVITTLRKIRDLINNTQ